MEKMANVYFETVGGKKVEIRKLQYMPEGKRHCFFYGGDLFLFIWKNSETGITGEITLMANGDVSGDLVERSNGRVLDSFKDKSNTGYRRHVEDYLYEDADVIDALSEDGTGDYVLKLKDSNWLEWFFNRKNHEGLGDIETDYLEPVVDDSDIIPESFEDCGLDAWFDELTAI